MGHSDAEPAPQDLPILNAPAEGVPAVVDTAAAQRLALDALDRGTGPVAVDVERAQSYRYSSKAYLLQLRRGGAGTFLVDPVAFETGDDGTPARLDELQQVIGDQEWIVHAATQDLPNLVQLGLVPTHLFDTELAGRLLGLPWVSLGPMVERYCGVHLLKEHSAVDWSIRPIPSEWLNYAALDVELLSDLRQALKAELDEAGKSEWARQEFDWLCRWALRPVTQRPDRWRRTSGSHQVKSTRGLALVREFWLARDQIARQTDRAPGRVLSDAAIAELASLVDKRHPQVPSHAELWQVHGFRHRNARRHQKTWYDTLERVAAMDAGELPPLRVRHNGVPAPRTWERINPQAWQRWETVRPAVVALAEELNLPVENLISPDALRQLLWQPEQPITAAGIGEQLTKLDVRVWQRELVAPLVAERIG